MSNFLRNFNPEVRTVEREYMPTAINEYSTGARPLEQEIYLEEVFREIGFHLKDICGFTSDVPMTKTVSEILNPISLNGHEVYSKVIKRYHQKRDSGKPPAVIRIEKVKMTGLSGKAEIGVEFRSNGRTVYHQTIRLFREQRSNVWDLAVGDSDPKLRTTLDPSVTTGVLHMRPITEGHHAASDE